MFAFCSGLPGGLCQAMTIRSRSAFPEGSIRTSLGAEPTTFAPRGGRAGKSKTEGFGLTIMGQCNFPPFTRKLSANRCLRFSLRLAFTDEPGRSHAELVRNRGRSSVLLGEAFQ
jgi:hypothetical protein